MREIYDDARARVFKYYYIMMIMRCIPTRFIRRITETAINLLRINIHILYWTIPPIDVILIYIIHLFIFYFLLYMPVLTALSDAYSCSLLTYIALAERKNVVLYQNS